MSNQGSLGAAVLDLTADSTQLFKDIDKAKPEALSAFQQLGVLGGSLIAAGITTAAAAITGITAMVWEAGNTLDAAYDTIQQRTGATGAQLEGLKKDFDEVFAGVPASADDAAAAVSGLNQRLGITGPVLQDTAKTLLEVTRLTGGDLSTNIEQFTRFIGDAGIKTDDASVALDTLYAISQKTGTGIDRLMQLSVQFGAPMREFGFKWVESAALLGKWEKEGVNTELVMGSLRIAAGKFAKDNIPLKKGLEDTFKAIKNAKTESEALALAMDTFGARAGPDMAAAIRENRFELGDLIPSISEADGLIMKTAEDTMDWGERWTLFKNRLTTALGPAGMKLMDAVRDGLKAIEDVVSRPEVQNGLMMIVNGIVELAQKAAAYLPTAIQNFFNFVEFLKNNQGVVVAILAVLGTAILSFAGMMAAAAWTALAPFLPVVAIIALVAAAAYLLYQAWVNDWGGIQEKTAALWAWLQPILQAIITWFQINIPVALQTLADFWAKTLLPAIQKFGVYWNTTLFPALQSVWAWMQSTLFPFLGALGNLIGVVIVGFTKNLVDIWLTIFWPAIQKLYGFLQANLFPILQAVGSFLGGNFLRGIQAISQGIQFLTHWLDVLAAKLAALHPPAWMTPGSPTPFEIGLWGINDALKAISGASLPNLSASMNTMTAPAIASGNVALGGAGTGANIITNKKEVTVPVTAYVRSNQDIDYLAQQVKKRIIEA